MTTCYTCGKPGCDWDGFCFECRAKENNPPVYETPPFAGGLPNPPVVNDLLAKALVRCTASLIRAMAILYTANDGGHEEMHKIVRVLEGDAHDMGIL